MLPVLFGAAAAFGALVLSEEEYGKKKRGGTAVPTPPPAPAPPFASALGTATPLKLAPYKGRASGFVTFDTPEGLWGKIVSTDAQGRWPARVSTPEGSQYQYPSGATVSWGRPGYINIETVPAELKAHFHPQGVGAVLVIRDPADAFGYAPSLIGRDAFPMLGDEDEYDSYQAVIYGEEEYGAMDDVDLFGALDDFL